MLLAPPKIDSSHLLQQELNVEEEEWVKKKRSDRYVYRAIFRVGDGSRPHFKSQVKRCAESYC